jgi:Zn-dependent peptidase ImmA (M78 family)/DNA-binding XRE family transcriptional regulator
MSIEIIVAERTKRLRLALGLDARELAEKVGVSPPTISRIENRKEELSHELLSRLARGLQCDAHFLTNEIPIVPATAPSLRAYADASKRTTDSQVADCITATEFIRLAKLQLLPDQLPDFGSDANSAADIEEAAMATRISADIAPDAPCGNAIRAAEKLGCVVLPMSTELGRHLGLSLRSDGIPIIGVTKDGTNDGTPLAGDRQRFTVAHELGHLVLHAGLEEPLSSIESSLRERQAHRFAGAFLAPADSLTDQLARLGGRVTLTTLRQLKETWGVSIKALVMRLQGLGVIDSDQARSFHKQISSRGWNKNEPVEVPTESARWMSLAIERVSPNIRGESLKSLAAHTGIGTTHINRWVDWSVRHADVVDIIDWVNSRGSYYHYQSDRRL